MAILLVSHASESRTRDKEGHFLSQRVPFMSPAIASKYVKRYRAQLSSCLDKYGKDKLQSCQDKTLEATDKLFQSSETYLRHKLNHYEEEGHLSFTNTPDTGYPTIGVVGDSLPAGSLSSGNIKPDYVLLVNNFLEILLTDSNPSAPYVEMGKNYTNSSVIKVFGTPQNPNNDRGKKLLFSYADCEECSFVYQLALEHQIPPNNIIISATGDSQRIRNLYDQFKKIALPLNHLPEYIFVSFTGNDICHISMEHTSAAEKYNQYFKEMVYQLQEAIKGTTPSPQGTHVIVIAAADVTHLITNEGILNQSVPNQWINHILPFNEDTEMTCRDIREGNAPLSEIIHKMCPYILSASPSDEERVEHIRSLHQAVVNAQRDAIDELRQNQINGFNFHFIDSILDVEFYPGDISPDCFHPSIEGHKRIADELLDDVRTILRNPHP